MYSELNLKNTDYHVQEGPNNKNQWVVTLHRKSGVFVNTWLADKLTKKHHPSVAEIQHQIDIDSNEHLWVLSFNSDREIEISEVRYMSYLERSSDVHGKSFYINKGSDNQRHFYTRDNKFYVNG